MRTFDPCWAMACINGAIYCQLVEMYAGVLVKKELTLRPQSSFSPGMQAAWTSEPLATSRISNRSSANAIMYGNAHTKIIL